jgi:hypothetical protein
MGTRRKASAAQLAALEKARATLAERSICEMCDFYDDSHGFTKARGGVSDFTRFDGSRHRYCGDCQKWSYGRRRMLRHLYALFAGDQPEAPGGRLTQEEREMRQQTLFTERLPFISLQG